MMTLATKEKELITIWNENGLKAKFNSNGKIIDEKVEELLNSLNQKKEVSHRTGIKELVVEFDDIVVRIDGYKKFLQNDVFLHFYKGRIINLDALVKNSVQTVEVERVKTLTSQAKIKNKSLVPDDYLDPISDALERRRRETLKEIQNQINKENEDNQRILKVNRDKKRRDIVVKVGSFIAVALTVGGISISNSEVLGKDDLKDTKKEDIVLEEVTAVVKNEPFEVALDIPNDFLQESSGNPYLSYNDYSKLDKAINVKNVYGHIIEKYAKKCGVDPKLVMGIVTQESGNHEYGLGNGSCGGLMQIEMSYWNGKEIEYYDFDEKENYVIKITEDVIKDPGNNILIGCAILQNELRMFNYNIFLGTLSYNQGYTNVNKILSKTAKETGTQKMELINNHDCLSWLDYTWVSGAGDPNYVQNVLQYTGFGYDIFEISCIKENGEVVIATTGPVIGESTKTI